MRANQLPASASAFPACGRSLWLIYARGLSWVEVAVRNLIINSAAICYRLDAHALCPAVIALTYWCLPDILFLSV